MRSIRDGMIPTEFKTLTLAPHQARRAVSLKAGERLLVPMPVVPQPTIQKGDYDHGHWSYHSSKPVPGANCLVPEGDESEDKWIYMGRSWNGFHYPRSEAIICPIGQPGDEVECRWVKHHFVGGRTTKWKYECLRIAALDVRQVGSVTEREAIETGIEPVDLGKVRAPHRGGLANNWNVRHPGHWPDGWAWFTWLERMEENA